MRVLIVLSLAIPIALQMCILGLLIWRKLQKRFPWFFVYILYALLEAILRLSVAGSRNTYFIVYWSTAVPGVVLTILALRESFLSIFWPETRFHWFRWVFWGFIVITLAYAGWQAWALPSKQTTRFLSVILQFESGLDIGISIFGLLYAAAIALFGILEHQRETAIILGFTANASISIFGWITRSVFGTRFRLLSEWIPAIAYIIAEVIWTKDLLRAERRLPEPRQSLEQMSELVDRYIAIVHRYLGSER